MEEIYGFIHIAVMGEYWRNILDDQLCYLRHSGLSENTKTIFAGVVGSIDVPKRLPGIEIIDRSRELELNELFTLRHLKTFCDNNPNCKIWYIHTKGAATYTVQTQAWRKYMEYFVIEKWEDCVRALDTHDVCGVGWHRNPTHHEGLAGFAGNFWWATSNYIKKLPSDAASHWERHRAEYNFLSLTNPKVKNFHAPPTAVPWRESLYGIEYTKNYYGSKISYE